MRARGRTMLSAMAGGLLLLVLAAPAASGHGHQVRGTWTNPVGACVQHIVEFDPATGDITCTGTSEWTGTWSGSTTWTFTGKLDPATCAGSGDIDEVFTGHAGRKHGKLTFHEHMTLDAAGNIDIRGKIVTGSGQLAGSSGRARWVGTSSAVDGSGEGTYSGQWHPPGQHKHHHH